MSVNDALKIDWDDKVSLKFYSDIFHDQVVYFRISIHSSGCQALEVCRAPALQDVITSSPCYTPSLETEIFTYLLPGKDV